MGWVTLSLRKKELISEHAYYQVRDLQISREKRALARDGQYNETVINNEQNQELSDAKSDYNSIKSSYRDAISAIREAVQEDNANGGTSSTTTYTDANGYTVDDYQNLLEEAQSDYSLNVNTIKSYYDDELELEEEMASDQETMLDEEQTEVETLMEDIASEISAVGDAISTEIQNYTIKLS